MSNAFDNHATTLTAAEKSALLTYSGDEAYTQINKALINGTDLGNNSKLVGSIDSAMNKNKLMADATVYRGISPGMVDAFGKPGTVFNHKPYASTSDSLKQSTKFAGKDSSGNVHLMEIKAKTGTKAVSMKGTTKYADEREILLGRNTKMKYTGQYTTTVPRPLGGTQTAIVHTFETVT